MNGTSQHDLWVEYLSAEACWELLASTPVGRVGVLVDSAPEVYPVNYAVDGRSLVFRTNPGNKLQGLGRSPSVCFQIDSFDPDQRTGWSVLVKGRADEVSDSGELHRMAHISLEHWTLGAKDCWVQIIPIEVSGRRIHRGPAADRRERRGDDVIERSGHLRETGRGLRPLGRRLFEASWCVLMERLRVQGSTRA